jgi:hypothetical protein
MTHFLPRIDQQTIVDKERRCVGHQCENTRLRRFVAEQRLGAELPGSWPVSSHERL